MTEKEKQLYELLVMYKNYALDLDRMLQGLLEEHFPDKYADLKQRGILLEVLLEQVSAPAQG